MLNSCILSYAAHTILIITSLYPFFILLSLSLTPALNPWLPHVAYLTATCEFTHSLSYSFCIASASSLNFSILVFLCLFLLLLLLLYISSQSSVTARTTNITSYIYSFLISSLLGSFTSTFTCPFLPSFIHSLTYSLPPSSTYSMLLHLHPLTHLLLLHLFASSLIHPCLTCSPPSHKSSPAGPGLWRGVCWGII